MRFYIFCCQQRKLLHLNLLSIAIKTPHVVIGKAPPLDSLKSVAIELIALKKIESEEEKINHDFIAKNELANRIKFAQQSVEKELKEAFNKAKWSHLDNDFPISPLSVIASKVASSVYTHRQR